MKQKGRKPGFTLVELLVVMGIIAILVAIILPAYPMAIKHANLTSCTARMRALGVAFTLYTNDNDGDLPGRATANGESKWPVLLSTYIGDPKCYADPGDPVASAINPTNFISASQPNGNQSSFFFNGFNDLGSYTNPSYQVRMVNITNPSNLIILGQKVNGNTQYYMDFVEGNQDDILNKEAYFGGANYTYADGSSRYMTEATYNNISSGSTESDGDKMWLVNQNYVIPPVPSGH